MLGAAGVFDLPFLKEAIGAVAGVGTFAYSCYRVGRRAGNKDDKEKIQSGLRALDALRADIERHSERFRSLENVVRNPQDFWLRTPAPSDIAQQQQALSSSVPIICVVNFKGGVGKTTICANLAAYFAQKGKRVLLVDCDYQGSLSDTVLTHARVETFKANAHTLLEGGHDASRLRATAERLSGIDRRLWIYPSFYGFSRTEIQMMFRWLIGQDNEIRYNLSQYLQSVPFKEDPDSAFDIVLIDAPPRLLTGVVNALVASTHVLIPTILDGQSHIATLNTISAINQFRQKLNPGLKILGVVPSLVSNAVGYNGREQHFIAELERQMPDHHDGPVAILKGRPIYRREELAKAGGSEIVFGRDSGNAATREVKEMFSNLGEFIYEGVHWKRADTQRAPAMPGQPKRAHQ